MGLKVGFEIHQQLDTGRKLFCRCPSMIVKNKEGRKIVRRFRAVAGELGERDIAAVYEQLRGKDIVYHVFDECDCLIDIDEEPPLMPDEEALKEAVRIALALHMDIVDEFQIMRKTIIDGSVPSGFQRTILIGLNGYVEVDGKRIGIGTLCLEEDSGRKLFETENEIHFALDRLGIPLVEIRTDPDIRTPEEAARVAEYLGLFLRSFKVRRGIGTIRQDVNVSIKGGARVEIKGFQELEQLKKLVEYEVIRQLNLIRIRNILASRISSWEFAPVDITDIIDKTGCRFLKGKKCLCIKLPGYSGLLNKEVQPGRRLVEDFVDIAKNSGFKGLIHSDELPKYGIDSKAVDEIKKRLGCGEHDAFVLIGGEDPRKICRVLWLISEKAKAIYEVGVEKEVRRANPDGTTSYLRPMPGSARMYPETDLLPIPSHPYILAVRDSIPTPLPEKIRKISKDLSIREDYIKKIALMGILDDFIEISKEYRDRAAEICNLLLGFKSLLKKELGEEIELDFDVALRAIRLYLMGRIAKDALPYAYKDLLEGHSEEDVVKKYSLDEETLREEIKRLLDLPFGKIMFELRKKYGQRVDGRVVKRIYDELKEAK